MDSIIRPREINRFLAGKSRDGNGLGYLGIVAFVSLVDGVAVVSDGDYEIGSRRRKRGYRKDRGVGARSLGSKTAGDQPAIEQHVGAGVKYFISRQIKSYSKGRWRSRCNRHRLLIRCRCCGVRVS